MASLRRCIPPSSLTLFVAKYFNCDLDRSKNSQGRHWHQDVCNFLYLREESALVELSLTVFLIYMVVERPKFIIYFCKFG